MASDERLARIGLAHLAGKPEAIKAELEKRAAEARTGSASWAARQQAMLQAEYEALEKDDSESVEEQDHQEERKERKEETAEPEDGS